MENNNRKYLALAAGLMLGVSGVNAQQLREGYIDAGSNTGSEKFHTLLANWKRTHKVSNDDNFYISRVKPRYRFRNAATQVRTNLTEKNDKKLVAWIPVGDPTYNALPNGLFDSEVFSMWPYVTHYGNWTSGLGRIPAAFIDVAHKNGVAVSGVASVPNAGLSGDWLSMIQAMGSADVANAAQFFHYYGINGMGYNSEWYDQTSATEDLREFHAALVKKMSTIDPLFENLWYDGTNDGGGISFDQGLASHNEETFGSGTERRTSLFFNYNWNRPTTMDRSIKNAENMKRDPLDLYCGVNMQGGEPAGTSWSYLVDRRLSIGLWGAHSNNMFWETRGELGSSDDQKQNAYLMRTERYFTGGTRNPANCPSIMNGHAYNAENYKWHGMSTFMTARSSMKWDLAEEPFITHFNLGNGKFFNYNGVRQNNNPWYNVGMQDYLPTWRWWFASKLLGNTAKDVPATGLDANFTWDDAYFGGSTIRISGSTDNEYLHLFKTEYALKAGDVITFKYKLEGGRANMNLVLSAKGSEANGVSYKLLETSQEADDEAWVEKTFTVGSDFNGKDLALVALQFSNAKNMRLLLGEMSIVRGGYKAPTKPSVTTGKLLHNSHAGMDGKLIWNVPNNKASLEPCYNIDVNTAFFKLYAQEEGKEPILMGTTTSWAGMFFSIPTSKTTAKVRLGVASVALDQKSESEIAWTGYMAPVSYTYSDDIEIDKTTIKPNEQFVMKYVDGEHEAGTWQLLDENGKQVYSGSGKTVTVNGLPNIGSYTLKLTGKVGTANQTREYPSYVQISDVKVGALPEINTLTANESENPITIKTGDKVTMKYTGRQANGSSSRGINLMEKPFGVKAADLGLVGVKSFSVAFWVKINKVVGSAQLLSVCNRGDAWPANNWGWLWNSISPEGKFDSFTWRGFGGNNELRYKYDNTKLPIGTWFHVVYTFDYDNSGNFRSSFYLNGKKQKLTAWNRTNSPADKTTDPGYQTQVYNLTNGMVIAVGGDAFGRTGLDGSIDNFQVWDKVMTDADVKTSMGTLNRNALPSGLMALWDVETDAASDYTFKSVGSKSNVSAGMHVYRAIPGEGKGEFVWSPSYYTSGCPFLDGNAYRVETVPTWRAPKAEIVSQSGNDTAGEAQLTYGKAGVRTVTLSLTNSLGQAQRTFSAITIDAPSAIDNVEAASEMKAYTVGENVIVEFAEAGNYDVMVVDVAGQAQARNTDNIVAGGNMQMHLAKAGVYIVTVKKDGKFVRTFKLIRK